MQTTCGSLSLLTLELFKAWKAYIACISCVTQAYNVILPVTCIACAATRNGCSGALDTTYVSSVSCRGQLAEADAPYRQGDSNTCVPDARRDAIRAALNFTWATVPTTNTDLARAVTTAPTMISVKADGRAWQLYRSGIASCNADNKWPATNRECCQASKWFSHLLTASKAPTK